MPNWCENQLTVSGDFADLQKFLDAVRQPNGEIKILETLIPMPDTLPPSNDPLLPDWYKWSLDNYGCKWPDVRTELSAFVNGYLHFEFDTPWSPPTTGIQTISAMYPSLVFELSYIEPGIGFQGSFSVINGVVKEDITEPFDYSQFEFID